MVKIWPGLLIALCAPLLQAAVSVVDDRGHTVTLAQPARRIVSLSPHLAEDLFAIGAGAQVVGTVDFSDYPPAAKRIARVGGYDGFDLERIRTLKPDLIVAWQSGNPPRQLAMVETLGIPVFHDDVRRLQDVPGVLERLGVLAGKPVEAGQVAARFRNQLAALEKQYAQRSPVRVFYQVWDRPLMTVNREQIISDALRICGAVNVFGDLPALTPTIDEEAVLAANPQLIVTSRVHDGPNEWLAQWQRWPQLAAVKKRQLVTLPRDLLIRMGPRLVDGVAALCEAVDKARQS